MKPLIALFILFAALVTSSCGAGANKSESTSEIPSEPDQDLQAAKQQVLDSVNNAQMANRIEQLRTDSIKNAGVTQHKQVVTTSQSNSGNTTVQTTTTETKKKGMTNTTKGALIGAGAGAATGAVAGALIDGKKGEGAIVGGLIGGAVGSGVGYAAGHKIDKKKK